MNEGKNPRSRCGCSAVCHIVAWLLFRCFLMWLCTDVSYKAKKKRLCEFAMKAGGRRDVGSQNREFTFWLSAVHTTYRNISRVTWRVLRHQTKFTTELVFIVNFITDQQTRLCDFHSQTFATPNLAHLLSVCLTDRQTMTTRIPLRRQCLNHQTKRIRIHYF